MAEDGAVVELQSLAAIASENGALLAFRAGDDATELEPVFLHVMSANAGEEQEVALIAVDDRHGLSCGRFIVNRSQLDAALAGADDVDEAETEPTVVPADWGSG